MSQSEEAESEESEEAEQSPRAPSEEAPEAAPQAPEAAPEASEKASEEEPEEAAEPPRDPAEEELNEKRLERIRRKEEKRLAEEAAVAERIRLEEERLVAEAETAQHVASLWQNAAGNECEGAVVWLHHQGETELSWQITLKPIELPEHKCGKIRWLWPRAPLVPSSVRGGASTFQWFDVKEYPICRVVRGKPDRARLEEDPADVEKAVCRLQAAVRALEVEGVPANRIVLGGFGMVAAAAIQAVLRAERHFAGAVLCSGWIPCWEALQEVMTDEGKLSEVLWCHGARDVVVEPRLAAEQARSLRKVGVPVRFQMFPEGSFDMGPEVVTAVQAFLTELFSSKDAEGACEDAGD